jgi:hypothetical protein
MAQTAARQAGAALALAQFIGSQAATQHWKIRGTVMAAGNARSLKSLNFPILPDGAKMPHRESQMPREAVDRGGNRGDDGPLRAQVEGRRSLAAILLGATVEPASKSRALQLLG